MDEKKQNEIESSYNKQIKNIEESINRIGLRQDEIKSYILDVNRAISEISVQISECNNKETQLKMRIAIQKNIELISKLYDSISSFESIRQRYQQDVSKLTESKIRFINVELRRVEEQLNSNSTDVVQFVSQLRNYIAEITKSKTTMKKINNDLSMSPEYSMD